MTKRGNIELIDEVLKLRAEGLEPKAIARRLVAKQRTVRLILRGEEMLSAGQVALLLGLHTNTVRRWADQGKLKGYRLGDRGDWRKDIEAFLRGRRR